VSAPAPFVVGVPRSGTTLLRLMLDAHPQLAIPPETNFIPRLVRAWRRLDRRGASEEDKRAKAFEVLRRHRRWADWNVAEEGLRRRLARTPLTLGDAARSLHLEYGERVGKPRWGDKTPIYLRDMTLIQEALPEVRFIHLLRDGRDVAVSWTEVSWGTETVLEAAEEWVTRIRKARRSSRRLVPGTYLEVRYEDLLAEPERVLRRVSEFVELPWDSRMLDYHRTAGERLSEMAGELERRRGAATITADERVSQHSLVAEPPREERAGRWRERLSPAERRQVEAVAGRMLGRLGYPVDG
jgi:Sulfotransferase family